MVGLTRARWASVGQQDATRNVAVGVGATAGRASGTGETPILKSPYSWREDVRQGGGVLDIYARMMTGYKKLRYLWPDSVTRALISYDNGIHAFDTAQPGL